MNYNYFVSYFFHKDNNTGFGNCNIEMEEPMKSMEDLTSIANLIKKDFNMENVVILNYKLLGE